MSKLPKKYSFSTQEKIGQNAGIIKMKIAPRNFRRKRENVAVFVSCNRWLSVWKTFEDIDECLLTDFWWITFQLSFSRFLVILNHCVFSNLVATLFTLIFLDFDDFWITVCLHLFVLKNLHAPSQPFRPFEIFRPIN